MLHGAIVIALVSLVFFAYGTRIQVSDRFDYPNIHRRAFFDAIGLVLLMVSLGMVGSHYGYLAIFGGI